MELYTMRKMIFVLSVMLSFNVHAWDAPEVFESACYEGCTPKMQTLFDEFLATPNALAFYPGMYSGECHHLSGSLNPDTTHYAGMLFNTDANGAYMTGAMQYFGESNGYANLSFEEAKERFLPSWKGNGRLTFHPTSTTTHFLNQSGNPQIVYWARQNLETKDILFLMYMKDFSTAFCRLKPNPNGFPQ